MRILSPQVVDIMELLVIAKKDLQKISDYIWEIPKSFRLDMKVPARIFASQNLLEEILPDRSLNQLVNVAALPGIQGYACAMPDIHEGYGFPIGGVAAVDYGSGVISPGGIGYDINCGVSLLTSDVELTGFQGSRDTLAQQLNREIPSGVGVSGKYKLGKKSLDEVLASGFDWLISQGIAAKQDLDYIESHGRLDNADPDKVSQHAKDRGKNQLGTMGAGNHFVEIGVVDRIFDSAVAQIFGLFANGITVLIHCGSRGLGHQTATDYIRIMLENLDKYGIEIPDKELACAPFSSQHGSNYYQAMAACANFAFVNRQLIAADIRRIWQKIFGQSKNLNLLYDVCHNIAKIENHRISGNLTKVIVHRKGATRAFGPQNMELPEKYQKVGQPVIIPGSMGTSSFVLVGTSQAQNVSFGSSCHGAGRKMSRSQARKIVNAPRLLADLERQGTKVIAGKISEVAEEAPLAYKNVTEVVDVVQKLGIAKKVASLKPLIVIKG